MDLAISLTVSIVSSTIDLSVQRTSARDPSNGLSEGSKTGISGLVERRREEESVHGVERKHWRKISVET